MRPASLALRLRAGLPHLNRTLVRMASNGRGCGPTPPAPTAANAEVSSLEEAVRMGPDAGAVIDSVKQYYGEVLAATEDLKTSACLTAKAPSPAVRAALARLPDEVVAKYYGCGSPFPEGLQGSGLRVLDLGCGSGRDCYVAAALVGPAGAVTGLDMTPAQLEVARCHADPYCRETLGYEAPTMTFVEGKIEDLAAAGIPDASVDLIISNCVVNLSPDKAAVLAEAYRALAPGGEVFFSDIYVDQRLPAAVRTHPVLLGECLGGALYEQDFMRLARAAGFGSPRRAAPPTPIAIGNPELEGMVGAARFSSITFRLFKLPGRLESPCEDYGQAVRYKGTLADCPQRYALDEGHVFEAGKWYEACGNTAAVVGESWMARHFEVAGDRRRHYGAFPGGDDSTAKRAGPAPAPAAAGGKAKAGPGGGCCG